MKQGKKLNSYGFLACIIILSCFMLYNARTVNASDAYFQGEGTEENPFFISTSDDMVKFSQLVSEQSEEEYTPYPHSYFKLTNNIDMSKVLNWVPIGSNLENDFDGAFDGNGYKISGLNVYIEGNTNESLHVGLFGYNSGTIKNLGVVNSNIYGSNQGPVYVGGIVGTNSGEISNTYNTGNVTASNLLGQGHTLAGGIAGESFGSSKDKNIIENSYNTGTIKAHANSSNGNANAGGIVGINYGGYQSNIISNLYNTGSVYSSAYAGGIVGGAFRSSVLGSNYIKKSYNVGEVEAPNAGGILGHIYEDATISESFNRGIITGELSTGGIVGTSYKGLVTNTYNEGLVEGGIAIGGLVGVAERTVIRYNYNIGKVTALPNSTKTYVGGIAGQSIYSTQIYFNEYLDNVIRGEGSENKSAYAKSLEEMKLSSTYNEFDFNEIWIVREHDTPLLRSNYIPLNGITLEPTVIKVGESHIIGRPTPVNATTIAGNWTSSNEKVATVDSTGVVTAHSKGYTVISVITNNGSYEANASIEVVQPVTKIELSSETTTIALGKEIKLGANVLPAEANNKEVQWLSSNPAIATVTEDGIVRGTSSGEARITVISKDSMVKASINITIGIGVEKINIQGNNSLLINDSVKLKTEITPSTAVNKEVKWSVINNTGSATISNAGILTGNSVGNVTVVANATDGSGIRGTYQITIKDYIKDIRIKNNPTKRYYSYGEAIDTTGGILNVEYGSGKTSEINIISSMISGYSKQTLGKQEIGVNYEGNKLTYTVAVSLATPTLKVNAISYKSNKISWSSVNGATGYRVYRATSKNGTYKRITTTTSTSFKDTNRTTGKTYYYKVRAYKNVDSNRIFGSYTLVKSGKPFLGVPENFIVKKSSTTSANITWSKVSGATAYRIYRADKKNGTYTLIKTTTSTSFTNKGIKKGKTYYYKIRAYKQIGKTKVFGSYTSVRTMKY